MSQVSFKQFCQLAELSDDELTEERLDEIWPFTDTAKQDELKAQKAKADFEARRLKAAEKAKQAELAKLVAPNTALFVNAKLEDELRSLDQAERTEMLQEYGVQESGLLQVIHAAYNILGLQSYLTAGPQEVRAWTIKKGATAPQAAGVIHGDFERGFIAADVVDFNDLLDAGSLPAARATGKVRTEGKTYSMQPNDVVEFKFNV